MGGPVSGREVSGGPTWSGMSDFGKLLIMLGAALLVAGIVLVVVARANLPLGRLPGDIVYRGKNTTFYFPLATSLLVSVLLSLVLYLVRRWRR
jgi:hypothetical protein